MPRASFKSIYAAGSLPEVVRDLTDERGSEVKTERRARSGGTLSDYMRRRNAQYEKARAEMGHLDPLSDPKLSDQRQESKKEMTATRPEPIPIMGLKRGEGPESHSRIMARRRRAGGAFMRRKLELLKVHPKIMSAVIDHVITERKREEHEACLTWIEKASADAMQLTPRISEYMAQRLALAVWGSKLKIKRGHKLLKRRTRALMKRYPTSTETLCQLTVLEHQLGTRQEILDEKLLYTLRSAGMYRDKNDNGGSDFYRARVAQVSSEIEPLREKLTEALEKSGGDLFKACHVLLSMGENIAPSRIRRLWKLMNLSNGTEESAVQEKAGDESVTV